MAMTGGTVTVDAGGVASGSGLSRALYDALLASVPAIPSGPTGAVAKQQLAVTANAFGGAIITYITANAVVSATVATAIPVATTGTAAAQTGATTTTGTATGTVG